MKVAQKQVFDRTSRIQTRPCRITDDFAGIIWRGRGAGRDIRLDVPYEASAVCAERMVKDSFEIDMTLRNQLAGPNSVIYREATNEDISALSEVRLSVQENVLSDPNRITREMYEAYLCESGKGWLCEVNGEVVGFAVASLADASIWALFVKPAYEGGGIGKRLLHLATEWLFDRQVSSIVLITTVGTRADAWYERQGWKRGELMAESEVRYRLDKSNRT